MKQFLLLLLIPFLSISQVQIGQDIDGEAPDDQSGRSLSLSSDGSILAIGAQGNGGNGSNSGHVRVYENQSGVWTQIGQDIDGEAVGDFSGHSVSLSSDGSIVAIGALYNDGNGNLSGHVRIYQNISGNWIQVGSDIDGEALEDISGSSVSLNSDGSVVAIGARINGGNGLSAGHVRVYQNISGGWFQIGQDIDGEAVGDQSAQSVSLSSDGGIVAIGAIFNDANGSNSGHVRVYENQSGTWTQIGSDIDGETANDNSGRNVSLSDDGSVVAVGANNNDGNGSNSGHVRIYQNQSGVWTQVGSDINGENFSDNSGYSVSLSSDGSIVAIGAINNSGNGSNSGHVRVYDLSSLLSSDSFVIENFSISPNPTTDKVSITLTNNLELKAVTIYNYFGQKIKTIQSTEIDLSELPTGVYIIEIETNKGKASRKIIKK